MSSRSANVARNASVGILVQLAVFGLGLIYRTILIHYLSIEYLGAQALFGDILNLLSVAEFGIGSTILFSMYAPLAQRDHARVAALLLLFKRLYRVVGLVVLVAGLAIAPFVRHFVKPGTSLPHLEIIYVLLLVDVVVGYWSAYRRTVFVADQQEYRVTLSTAYFALGRYVVQGVVLMATGSFLLTLVVKIVGTLVTNLYQSWLVGRTYPEIIAETPSTLEREFLRENFRNMRAMLMHRVSGLVTNATDSILISRFFGLSSAGVYSNYLLIVGMATALINQVTSSTIASVGHLTATESVEHAYRVFRLLDFGYRWVYGFVSLSLLVLLNPFLTLWIGSEFTFHQSVVAVICLNVYVLGRGAVVQAFRFSRGLYWNDRYKGPTEAVLNVVISLLLLQQIGIAGVFLGSAIAHLLAVVIEPYMVFKHYFHRPLAPYLLRRLGEFAELVLLGAALLLAQQELAGHGVLGFVALVLLCLVGINGSYLLRFRSAWEWRELASVRRSMLASISARFAGSRS